MDVVQSIERCQKLLVTALHNLSKSSLLRRRVKTMPVLAIHGGAGGDGEWRG